jgi:DNA-binding NarL/FixJ family response regulator
MAIKIAIGCHSYLLGEGLKKLFNKEDEIDIMCIFDEGIDIEEILKMNPDLIIADFKIFRAFPEDFTIDKKLKILLLGDNLWLSEVERQIPEFILRGVFGIIPPEANSEILKKAIKVVYSGELWLDRKMIKKIITKMGPSERRINLTKKEKEIVSLICHGYRNKEIAQKLDISEQTVKSHCNRIFKKVGVSDRLQLALYTHKVWPGYI